MSCCDAPFRVPLVYPTLQKNDDQLSWRVSTDGTSGSPTYGQVIGQQGSYPFGESWYSSNGNEFAFTTYQRDSESGLDYAMARYYDSTAARFCSADPVSGQVDDPQTWDRYTYVRNDPLNLTDPSGESWLSWLIDAVIGTLAIALPELDPALFSFLGDADAVTTTIQTSTSTATMLGQTVGTNAGIFMTVTATSNVSTLGLGIIGSAAAGGSQAPSGSQKQPQQQKKSSLCNNKQAVNFIKEHQGDAANVAKQLGVPTENVLGLSGIESQWGTSNAAQSASNFFGLHGGASAPFATGTWYTSGGVAMSMFSSYLSSAQSFASQYGGFVANAANPISFAKGLVRAGFNPGKAPLGNPNFVRDTANTIDTTRERMKQCTD